MGDNTEVVIHAEACQECPSQCDLERLYYHMTVATEWLETKGMRSPFRYITKDHDGFLFLRKKAVYTGMTITSRRDLFLSAMKSGKSMIHQRLNPHRANERNDTARTKRPKTPAWKTRLGAVYYDDPDCDVTACWPSVNITSGCISCGLCSDNCPVGAFTMKVENGIAAHLFNSGICIDCRICGLFCPTKSVTRTRKPNPEPFLNVTVNETPVTYCAACGDFVVSKEPDHALCYWCSQEPKQGDMIRNAKMGMSSLNRTKVLRSPKTVFIL